MCAARVDHEQSRLGLGGEVLQLVVRELWVQRHPDATGSPGGKDSHNEVDGARHADAVGVPESGIGQPGRHPTDATVEGSVGMHAVALDDLGCPGRLTTPPPEERLERLVGVCERHGGQR